MVGNVLKKQLLKDLFIIVTLNPTSSIIRLGYAAHIHIYVRVDV